MTRKSASDTPVKAKTLAKVSRGVPTAPRAKASGDVPTAPRGKAERATGAATVAFRLRISKGEDIAVGPGKIDLLEAIATTGSITAAAKQVGMSYRRAWLLVDTMNRSFRSPVVTAEAGGQRGGGTALTPLGAEIVQRYRRIEAAAARAGAADLRALVALLAG
jgi:molybdate transport system regulatory protein